MNVKLVCHDAKLVFLGVWLEGCEKIGVEFDIHLHEIKMATRLKKKTQQVQ